MAKPASRKRCSRRCRTIGSIALCSTSRFRKPNAQGNLCPYAEHEPQTIEGWEAWDIALRCAGQLRMAGFLVIGIDMGVALKIAEALGYSPCATAVLLQACEEAMAMVLNKRLRGLK